MNKSFNIPYFILVLFAIAGLFFTGFRQMTIDTDITRHLPRKDRVIADAGVIFKGHPMQDQVIIDLGLSEGNGTETEPLNRLTACADAVEDRLRESGLFRAVGAQSFQDVFPELVRHMVETLPVQFNPEELETQVSPRLDPEQISTRLAETRNALLSLDGIGQAAFIAEDPLGLKDLVLARLSGLAPVSGIRFHNGKLISADGGHLLIVAQPQTSGTDTAFARHLSRLMDDIKSDFKPDWPDIAFTPYGAYRAALDNERIARKDTERAILLATVGIALLLIFAFPRPLIGLLAFLPALAGTGAAFFLISVLYDRVSIMALGFGGAIISITVDHGIAYLLFLDRPEATTGRTASREIRAVGLIAALTTMGAFGSLYFTDFPIFEQLGVFTALGIGFSFLFVHLVFPRVFPHLPPANPRNLPIRKVADRLFAFGKTGAWMGAGLALVLLFFARPAFNVQLSAMNTVGKETKVAEDIISRVWGQGIFSRIFVMIEGETADELQAKGDRLAAQIEADLKDQTLEAGFIPAMIFPGQARHQANFDAWRSFWNTQRRQTLRRDLAASAENSGFAPDAFAPFLKTVSPDSPPPAVSEIPESFRLLMSMARTDHGTWALYATLTPGPAYDPHRFHVQIQSIGRIFDPNYFSQRLGKLLFDTFLKMAAIIGVSVTILLLLFFLDIPLTLIALAPVAFAFVCTLGVLNLMGRPLDIPALMLSIIVMGMGIDYSLYIVRSRQRYAEDAAAYSLVRTAVCMAAASTIIGFGVLCFAEHSLLKSAGLTSLLGIGFALTGAFLLLPPLLRLRFKPYDPARYPHLSIEDRVRLHFQNAQTFPRMFARFKMQMDPMFRELPELLNPSPEKVRHIFDIGCGFGVPAGWMLEFFPEATLMGIDPDGERVIVANRVHGGRGLFQVGAAPEIHPYTAPADLVTMLDMTHFIDDEALYETLSVVRKRLTQNGVVLMRSVVIPENGRFSRLWRFEAFRRKIADISAFHRTKDHLRELIETAGFKILHSEYSGGNKESVWFKAVIRESGSSCQNGSVDPACVGMVRQYPCSRGNS